MDFESVFVSMTYSFIWVGHSDSFSPGGRCRFIWARPILLALFAVLLFTQDLSFAEGHLRYELSLCFPIGYAGFYILSGIISGSFLVNLLSKCSRLSNILFQLISFVDLISFVGRNDVYELIGSIINRARAEFVKSYPVPYLLWNQHIR